MPYGVYELGSYIELKWGDAQMEYIMAAIYELPNVLYVSGAFLLLALCIGIKPPAALRQALMIGSGLIGIQVISSFMFAALEPSALLLGAQTGLKSTVLCTGMSTWFGAMMTIPFVVLIYPLGIVVNRFLLKIKFTKGVDVDFINYFCFLTPAVPVWLHTKNPFLCLGIFVFFFVLNLKLADLIAPMIQNFYQLEGVSVMHHAAGLQAVYCMVINWILDKIPGVNQIHFTLGDMRKRLGFLGEPLTLCFLTGVVIGALGKQEIESCLMLGLTMAVIAQLFPKIIGIFMEGLSPIATRLRELLTKGLNTDGLYMGVDAAVVTGDPDVAVITTLWMPIYVVLHILLPWSQVLPGPESFSVSMMVALCLPFAGKKGEKGDVFRTLVMLLIFTGVLMYTAGYVAPYVTELYQNTGGFVLPEQAVVTTSGAYHAYDALAYYLFKMLGIAH